MSFPIKKNPATGLPQAGNPMGSNPIAQPKPAPAAKITIPNPVKKLSPPKKAKIKSIDDLKMAAKSFGKKPDSGSY